jgi:hypothetical protein
MGWVGVLLEKDLNFLIFARASCDNYQLASFGTGVVFQSFSNLAKLI